MQPARAFSRYVCAGLATLGTCTAAFAQDADEPPGLYVAAGYTGDFRRNTTGGLAVGNAYSDSIDLGVEWTTTGLFSAATLTTSLSLMHLGGADISGKYVGDAQGINNIEAENGWYLYESWLELSFGESTNSLRAGVLDLNSEFDTPVTSGLFSASPFGIGTELSQSGQRGPGVWPITGLGLRAAGVVAANVHWRFGAYDGAPGTDDAAFTSTRVSRREGALLIGEVEFASERIHKLSFGSWAYTARFERVDAPLNGATPARSNAGLYALLDARLGSVGTTDLDGALRAGTASGRFNVFDRYVGAAVTATHLWTSRPDDAVGVGVAYAHAGAPYRALAVYQGQPARPGETTVEIAYRAAITEWCSVLPNVQYVRDPGMNPGVANAWVAGVRFEMFREKSWPLSARRAAPADESYARAP